MGSLDQLAQIPQIACYMRSARDIATALYCTGIDPFTKKEVYVAKGLRDWKMQRALMQFFRLFRGMRVWSWKRWTWYPLLELGQHLLGRKTHVHQLTVSRLRPARLSLCPPRLPRGPGHFSHRTTPGTLALLPLWLRRGLRPGRHPTHLPHPAHRPQTGAAAVQSAARVLLRLRPGATGQTGLRRAQEALHAGLRTLCPGVVPSHDHPGRRRAPPRRLGYRQGHPGALPATPLRQAQAA